jgi:hypothetical protein
MSNQHFSPEISFIVLAKYGVSLAEYYAMGTVGYGIFLPPKRLAQHSFNLAGGDPRGELTVSEHLDAVYSCIQNGWLELLSSAQCECEMMRQQSSPNIKFVEMLEPGVVSFTRKGYVLYRQFILEIFGEDHIRQMDSFWM